jgi:hypothetical protein
MRDRCSHATQRCKALTFSEFTFEPQVFFQQSRVVDCDCDLVREESDD